VCRSKINVGLLYQMQVQQCICACVVDNDETIAFRARQYEISNEVLELSTDPTLSNSTVRDQHIRCPCTKDTHLINPHQINSHKRFIRRRHRLIRNPLPQHLQLLPSTLLRQNLGSRCVASRAEIRKRHGMDDGLDAGTFGRALKECWHEISHRICVLVE
jgi:hypothetical protein